MVAEDLPDRDDERNWPQLRGRFEEAFRARTRDEWVELLQPLDACFSPVLTLDEALAHEQNLARDLFVHEDGVLQAAPAPRFSRTPGTISGPAAAPGEHTDEALGSWGFALGELARLREAGAIAQLPLAPGS
jgi:alpha-methylacyl-CoA racemase